MKDLTSIIILSYNTLEMTRMCLESIRAHTREAYELIVVDNASEDGSLEYLREQADVRLIENRENMGFPKGCNQGLEIAQGDSLLLLNSDTVVTENWLTNLKKGLYSEEKVGAVGCVANYVCNNQQIYVSYGNDMEAMQVFAANFNHSDPSKWEERPHLVGFCYLFRREVYEAIGGLDERFTPGNFEDNDYSLRILQKGFKLLLLKDTFIHHWGSSSFKEVEERKLSVDKEGHNFWELNRINRQKFYDKWQVPNSYERMDTQKVVSFIRNQEGKSWSLPVRHKRMVSVAIMQKGEAAAELFRIIKSTGMGDVCYVADDERAGDICEFAEGSFALAVPEAMAVELYKNGALDCFVWLGQDEEGERRLVALEFQGVNCKHFCKVKEFEAAEQIEEFLAKTDFGKRVALISHMLDNSGAPRALLGAARAFLSEGWKVVLFTPQGGALESAFDELGVQVIVDKRIIDSDFADMPWTQQYDLLFVNTIWHAHCFHAREPFPPVLWWIHEGAFMIDQYPVLKKWVRNLQEYDTSGVLTIPVSCVAAETMKALAPAWPLSASLSFGVEDIDFTSDKHPANKVLSLALVGHMQAVKGQDLVVAAVSLLPKDVRNIIKVYFIGGEGEDEVLRIVREAEKAYPEIEYLGELPHTEVLEWYKKIDMLLCPSRCETMSITAVEAMAAGIPCLVSDRTGIYDYIKDGENGLVCKAGNVKDLAAKLIWAVRHRQELADIGLAGRRIYEENFRPEIFSKKIMSVVEALIHSRDL